MRRIKAFTIMELTVAVFISGFLFGIALMALQTLQQRNIRFTKASSRLVGVSTLSWILESDFNEAEYLQVGIQPHTILFVKDSLTVAYTFTDGFILREQLMQIDTFHINVTDWKVHMQGVPVSSPGNPFDMLILKTAIDEQELVYSYYKRYSAAQLMKINQQRLK
jgi:type II secretory pathway pseudopilin PulG